MFSKVLQAVKHLITLLPSFATASILTFCRCCNYMVWLHDRTEEGTTMNVTGRFARGMFPSLWARLILFSAATFLGNSQTLDHFDFSAISSPRQAYVPFRIILTAKSSTGATVRSFSGTVQLTANSAGGPLSVEAFSALKFASGQWVGIVAVNEAGTDVSLQVRDPGSGRTGTSALFQVDPANFRVIDSLPVISIASDRTRDLLYASVGPTNGAVGILLVIDPASGNIIDTRGFDGGIGRIEMSRDASTLYVVTDDESKVRRLRLPDFAEQATLDLGEWEAGKLNRADDLAVHPTNPTTIAITKKRRELSPRFTGVSVFEDKVEKKIAAVFAGEANAVVWGAKPDRLYGLNNETTPSSFFQYDVTATEISVIANRWNLLNPFDGQMEFVEGRLYCTTGRIIDPETFTIYGELANANSDALMLALPSRKRIIYFTPSSLGFMLTYDAETLQLVGSNPFPMPRGYGSGVAFWGDNGIALHDGKRLFLAENRLIPSGPAADIEVTAVASQGATGAVGVEQEMEATVRNLGPNDAGAVVIKVTGPADAVLTGGFVVGANATTKVANREITFELASLASGAQLDVKFTAYSNVEAWEPFSIAANGTGLDPNSSNNAALVVLKAAPALGLNSPIVFKLANTASASDPIHGLILVAPSSGLAPWGNSIVAINPTSGEISQPVLVGPRPSEMAVSDDGKYLYVGFQGVPEVRRFLLPSLKPDLTMPMGADGFLGPRFAGQMDVRPAHPTDVAVTRPNNAFGFFRNGVEVTPDRSSPETVRFIGPDRIYAHEDSWGIFRFDISDSGLTWVTIMRDVEQYGTTAFISDGGKLYFADGQIFDAETGAKTGTFFVFGPYLTPPIVDQNSGHALFLQRTLTNNIVAAFDLSNYSQVASNSVPGSLGTANGFSRWSSDGVVFSATSGIGILKTDLIRGGAAELRVDSVTVGGAGSVTIRFSGLSPGQYVIEQCSDLGGSWSQLGNPFTELTAEVPITSSEAQKFYRLVRLP
jgi:DNA-binding beta-propeller fold protein YncE